MILCAAAIGFFSDEDPSRAIEVIESLIFLNKPSRAAKANPLAFAAGINVFFNKLNHFLFSKCWAVLLTLEPADVAMKAYNDQAKLLYDLLKAPNLSPDVYLAVGTALVYGEELFVEADEESPFEAPLAKLQSVQSLFTKNGKSKQLKANEMAFQAIIDYFESGEVPEERFKVVDTKVTTETWEQFIRLSFVKQILQGGLEPHLRVSFYGLDLSFYSSITKFSL
jgi:hypothetical protein